MNSVSVFLQRIQNIFPVDVSQRYSGEHSISGNHDPSASHHVNSSVTGSVATVDTDTRIYREIVKSRNEYKYNGAYKPGMFDAWAMVITTVLVGQYFGWNAGLQAGCGSYIIGQVLMGLAFIFFVFSLAEIVSTTSFAGGAYGMARVVLGFYMGFLVASFELMEYMGYIAFNCKLLTLFFIDRSGMPESTFPWMCLLLYIFFALLLIDQNYFFWRLNMLFALCSLIILLIFCFGSLPFVDFLKYAPLKYAPTDDYSYYSSSYYSNSTANSTSLSTTDDYYDPTSQAAWFNGGMIAFLQVLPFATWGFGGVESSALITDMMENPRINLSYGMAASVLTLFATMMFVMFVAMSLPPGANDLYFAEYLMNTGFEKMGINNNAAEWLTVPAQIAYSFGFAVPSYKLLQAISSSHFVPQILELHTGNHMRAVICVMLISYLLSLLSFYVEDIDLSNIGTVFACLQYLSTLYAYYKMKTDFSSRDHKFTNPFGIAGAIFAAIIFMLTLIALLFLQSDYNATFALLVYWGLLTIYYYGYAKEHQNFSEDEQKTLLVLHVMSTNKRKRGPLAKRRRWMQQAVIAVSNNNVSSPPHSHQSSHANIESSRRSGGIESARKSDHLPGTAGSPVIYPSINPNVQNFIEHHADAIEEEHDIVTSL